MNSESNERAPYEAPAVTDFGSIEEITQGHLAINLDDLPIGAKVVQPLPSLPLPKP